MSREDKVLSDEFIEYVFLGIRRYYWTHPTLVLVYVLIYLLDFWLRMGHRKFFIPKYIVGNRDRFKQLLLRNTTGGLASIAFGLKHSGTEKMLLGKGSFSKEYQEYFMHDFGYAAYVPDFFERLYIELEKYAEGPQTRHWYLEKSDDGLHVLSTETTREEDVRRTSFQQAKALNKQDRKKFTKANSL